MKKHWTVCGLILLSFLVLPALVFANGFAINENGTKAFGMGGAFVAQADDPSAVYFNPAGIVQLDGLQVTAGFAVIMPSASFTSNGTTAFGSAGETTDIKDATFFIPNIYATYKLDEKWSFGFGGFTNFGLATEWPDDWEGRYITGGTKAAVETFSVNPVVAFRPVEKISLSVGPVLQYMNITLENKQLLGIGVPDADVKLEGDDWDWGWNLGLLYWVTDDVKIGASYRSEVKHSITGGDIDVTGTPFGAFDISDTAEADIDLPAILYLGVAWTTGPLTLEFDAQWTGWSSYDKLEADFDMLPTVSVAKDWDDVWGYRFGAQYKINDSFDVRAGIIFDESPVPDETFDPLIPSGDRWLYTLGCSYHIGAVTIDAGYNYLDDDERTFDNDVGNYNETAPGLGNMTGEFKDVYSHLFMLSLTYRF